MIRQALLAIAIIVIIANTSYIAYNIKDMQSCSATHSYVLVHGADVKESLERIR
jgi:hypothetical protein